ncbi:MAG: hypothetical protein HWN68_06505 [Desulfobacterales bacterium]|nr:hypothetical protein [Desulfobacterales bacterium]
MEQHIVQWVERVAILLVAIIIAWEKAKRWYYGKNNRDRRRPVNPAPNMVPGKGDICIKHGEKLVKIETEIKNIKEYIKNMKDKKK